MMSDNRFCLFVRACLSNNVNDGLSKENQSVRMKFFTDNLQIFIPFSNMRRFGHTLSLDHIIMINRFLEIDFSNELVRHCRYITKGENRYLSYKEAYEAFLEKHHIDIEDDITFDALKKMEYRSRKKSENCVQSVLSLFST